MYIVILFLLFSCTSPCALALSYIPNNSLATLMTFSDKFISFMKIKRVFWFFITSKFYSCTNKNDFTNISENKEFRSGSSLK